MACTIFIVDDDQAVRQSLARMLAVVGYETESFPDAESFIKSYDPARPGCAIVDLRMPGMSGLELQQQLIEQQIQFPIIFLTAHGDVPHAVEALHSGAIDFVEKPYDKDHLLERVQEAIDVDASRRRQQDQRDEVLARLEQLTSREREVLDRLVDGRAVKQIAAELGTSRHTVKHQRASILKKFGVDSDVELANALNSVRTEAEKV